MSADKNFMRVVLLTDRQNKDGTREECVLRFFAYLYHYKDFEHIVKDFLTVNMSRFDTSFEYEDNRKLFRMTFAQLEEVLPEGIVRPNKKGKTPLVLYEAVAVGAALAIQATGKIVNDNPYDWMNSPTLRAVTTGATNSKPAVIKRIEYCRDRFLGVKDVV